MTDTAGEDGDAGRARQEAADWFARLRAAPGDAERAAFEAWRTAAPKNGETYDRLARQWEQSKFLANTTLGRGRDLGRARAWHRQPVLRTAAVAALVVLVVGAALLLRSGAAPEPAGVVTYAGKGDAVRTMALTDGSRITLDRNSLVRVAFSGRERRLELLKGRARFDVAHDPSRAFIVVADGGSVIAHGTVFDVDLQPTRVRVVLLRGAVEVRGGPAAGEGQSASRRLSPGQTLVYAHGKIPSLPVAVDPAETDWPSAMLSFDGIPLREAVAAFNRRNGTKLSVGSDGVGKLRVTGAFAADDPVGFAQATAAMFRLDLRRESDASLTLQ